MLIAQDAEFPALRAQTSKPLGKMTGEGEVTVIYKMSESKKLQMWNEEAVTKIEEKRLDHDWSDNVKIADCYIEDKVDFTEMFSDFESM